MAISAANLVSNSTGANQSSYTTASITPGANKLILAVIKSTQAASGQVNAIPTLTGNGLTWVEVGTIQSGNSAPGTRTTLFRAMGASPSAGAVTIDFGGVSQNYCGWSIGEFDGIDTGGSNGSAAVVQSKTAFGTTGTTATADFDNAFGDATNNATYSGITTQQVSEGIAPEAGFTELGEITSGVGTVQTMWRLGEDQTPAPTWVTNTHWAQVIAEIKAAGGNDFDETGKTFTITSTITATDLATMIEALTDTITSTVTGTDVVAFLEAPALSIVSEVTGTDVWSGDTPGTGTSSLLLLGAG